MATAQRPSSAPAQQHTSQRVDEAAALLEQMIQSFTPNEKTKAVYTVLMRGIDTLRELLPDIFKSQAERYVKRAMLEFDTRPELKKCTPESFIKAVLDAAECGLAIDGKLAYAVPYDNSKKDANGNWYTVKEANFQPSYMGVVAVAKRIGLVKAVYGDTICQNDIYKYVRRIGDDYFEHERAPIGTPRGDVLGAYQKIVLPSGLNHIEVMDIHELDAIMETSKSYKADSKGKTPWKTNKAEMQKKTVIHRAFKMYQDDPGMVALMRAVESDYDLLSEVSQQRGPVGKVGRSAINDALTPKPAKPLPSTPRQDDDPFAGSQTHHDAAEGVDDAPGDEVSQEPTDPLAGLYEAVAACKTKADCSAVLKRYMKPGLTEEQINEVSAACDEKSDQLPDAGKAKQKSFEA